MKIRNFIIFSIIAIFAFISFSSSNLADAQLNNGFWIFKGGQNVVTPLISSWNIRVPGMATSTTGCLSVNSNGDILPDGNNCLSTENLNDLSTAWISGGNVTINSGDDTKFDITAGTGIVVNNHIDSTAPTSTLVSYGPFTAQTVTNLASQDFTQLGIDKDGNLIQGTPVFSTTQLRDVFTIGFANHFSRVRIDFITTATDVIGFNSELNLRDLTRALGTSINVAGNVISANGTNLSLDSSAGLFYASGVRKDIPKNPNYETTSATTTFNFLYLWKDGSGGFNSSTSPTALIPSIYDDGTGGANSPSGLVASNRFAIHRVFYNPSPFIIGIHFGQATYSSMSEAVAALETEDFTPAPLVQFIPVRAWIITRGDATDLTNTDQAMFFESDLLGLHPKESGIFDGVANMFNVANGIVTTQITASTTSDGSTITLNVARNGGGDLSVQFNGNNFAIDTTPATTTALTAGTVASPVENFVFFERDSSDAMGKCCKEMQVNTTGFPLTEHAPIGRYFVQSAVDAQATGGLYKEHLYDNNLGDASDKMGMFTIIADRLRVEHAVWDGGVVLSFNGSGTGSVTMETTSGTVWQLRDGIMPAVDDEAFKRIKNDPAGAYSTTTDLNTILVDSNNVSMTGKFYKLVFWGIRSENASSSALYINLPSQSFNSQGQAEANNTSADFSVPIETRGTSFMIAEVLVRNQGDTTFTIIDTTDLRGLPPGGVTTGGGINQVNDFPDGASGFSWFNVVDDSLDIHVDLSGLSAARDWTMPDRDLDLGNPIFDTLNVLGALTIDSTATSTLPFLLTTGLSVGEWFEVPFITATSTATSTFAGGVRLNVLDVQSTTATSTFSNGLRIENGTVRLDQLISCSEALETDSAGNIFCGTDATGSAGDPNLIQQTLGGTVYFSASTTDALSFMFLDGFVSQASSTITGTDIAFTVSDAESHKAIISTSESGNWVDLSMSAGGALSEIFVDADSSSFFQFDDQAGGQFFVRPADIMTLTGSAKVGFGTSSPYARLSVVGQGVFETLHATGTGSSLFDGRLGIATTSSFAPLAVLTNSDDNGLIIEENSGGEYFRLFIDSGGGLNFVNEQGNGLEMRGALISSSNSATPNWQFNSSTQFSIVYAAGTYATFISNSGTTFNAIKADLDFTIKSDTEDESFVLQGSDGFIGIGTSSPYARLSVVGETVAEFFSATSTTATSTFAGGFSTLVLDVQSTTATSTFGNGMRIENGTLQIDNLVSTVIGTDATGSVVGISDGRSLTLTSNALDIDSEIFTYGINFPAQATTTADGVSTTSASAKDFGSVRIPDASTIISASCNASDVGTSTLQIEIRTALNTAGSDVFYETGIRAGADIETASTTLQNTAVSAGQYLIVYVADAEPTGSRPILPSCDLELTKDD